MTLDHLHLAALTAVIREGSFEKAAACLHVTPSAISQRIRLLEERMGAVLVIREAPCRPTTEGLKIYRHALQVELLEKDLMDDLRISGEGISRALPVAVNADSIEMWFTDAASLFFHRTGHRLEIFADDQEYTSQWLKEGRVLAAVTTSAKPVQGCRIEKLGKIRYLPLAAPSYMKQHFPHGFEKERLAQVPVLAFNRKDRLQYEFARKIAGRSAGIDPPCHWTPSTHSFHETIAAGLGWGLVVESMAEEYLKKRRMVYLMPDQYIDVMLYWQSWRLESPTLDALTKAVREAARKALR